LNLSESVAGDVTGLE